MPAYTCTKPKSYAVVGLANLHEIGNSPINVHIPVHHDCALFHDKYIYMTFVF